MGLRQIFVLALCFLLNLLDGLDIIAMSVSAPLIASAHDFAPQTTGYMLSAALLGMTLGAIFLSPLADIFGRSRVVAGAAALAGVSMIVTSQSDGVLSVIIASRIATGLGVGMIMSCTTAIATEHTSERLRHVLVPIVIAGYPVGAIIVSLGAPAIIANYGWVTIFLCGGMASLICAILALIFIRETLQVTPQGTPQGTPQKPSALAFLDILSKQYWGRNLRLWALFFSGLTTMYLLMSWIPYLFTMSGFTSSEGSYALSLLNMGGVLGIFVMSALTLRIRLSRLVIASLLCSAAAMVMFNFVADQRLSINYLMIGLIGFFFQSGYNGLYAIAATSYPPSMRATGVGLAIGIGRFGAVAAPIVGGYLIGGGWTMAQIVILLVLPVGVMVGLVATHNHPSSID